MICEMTSLSTSVRRVEEISETTAKLPRNSPESSNKGWGETKTGISSPALLKRTVS
jgi:hypothetical protein